jgi:hypothetical protein
MRSEPFVFGATLDQVDELYRAIRVIAAIGDVISTGGADHLTDHSLPALGGTIYNAAEEIRETFNRISKQKLKDVVGADSPAVARADRPVFADDKRDCLHQARSILRMLDTTAARMEGAEGIAASCRMVSDMVGEVIEYVETDFDTSSEDES